MSRATTIKDIEIELEKLSAQKDDIDDRVHGLEAALRHFESLPPDIPAGQRTEQITNAISEMLEQEHPLHRTVIYSRLQALGIHVGGQDPVNNTGAYMSGDARFKSLGRGMWDIEEPPQRGHEELQRPTNGETPVAMIRRGLANEQAARIADALHERR